MVKVVRVSHLVPFHTLGIDEYGLVLALFVSLCLSRYFHISITPEMTDVRDEYSGVCCMSFFQVVIRLSHLIGYQFEFGTTWVAAKTSANSASVSPFGISWPGCIANSLPAKLTLLAW